MSAVSEFSTMLSRQVSQRLHLSISPLTEANLYKHTITASPPSKDAKLKHILSYVEMQRELIALEEERHRCVIEKSRTHPTRCDLSQESHGSQGSPHYRHSQQPQPQPQPQQQQQQQQEQHPEDLLRLQKQQLQRELSLLNSRRTSKPSQWCASPIASTPAVASAPRYHYGSPRHLDYIPDCLDPSMALPRGLPRTTTHHDHNIYRDSFYSGIGQENDWRQLEQLDPDSLAGIHIYGDTTDLQQQPSPVSTSYKYSGMGYNFNAFTPTSKWQGQSLQHQQPNNPRPEDEDDEFRAEITARQSRQPAHQFHDQEHLQQQQPRQLASPASTFVEKERKLTRFSSRFSFLNRRRQTQDHQQPHRNDSMPTSTKDAWSPGSGSNPSQQRFPSLTIRPLGWSTTHGAGDQTGANGESRPRVETPTSKTKGNNRVKQIFKEVLSLATKKKGRRSPEPPFRDISLPSTYIRATPSPLHLQKQDPVSPYSPNHHAVTMAQRKGLITPVSRTDTAPSNYHNDNTHINNVNININNINGKSTRNARESLVDPIQPHLAFQKMELGDDEDELPNQSPFGQTSLTPPPASSVLRHSASSHHLFGHGLGDGEPIFISPEATEPEPALPLRSSTLGEVPVARPSSQLMPVTKELVHSGCDTMGGQEHHAIASNTITTFNPSQSRQIPNNPSSSHPEKEQQQQPSGIHSLDDDRRVSMSTFEHGAKVMAIAQVQKVDLEGLRQSHHHHSPPIHSHSLNMVTVEAPFA